MFFVYSVLRAFRPISGRALKLNLKQWISSEQYSTICMAWSPSLNAIEKLVEIKFQEREKGTMTLCKVARHTAKQTLHQTRSWASQTNNCTNCAHYWLGRLCTLIECDVFLQSGLIFKIGPLCCKQFVASETEQQWDQRQDQTVLSKVSRLFPLRTQLGLHRWQFSNGRVTRLNRTIKDSQKEKQVISCHQFNSVGNPVRMLFCYKNKAECLYSWWSVFDNWNLCCQFCGTFLGWIYWLVPTCYSGLCLKLHNCIQIRYCIGSHHKIKSQHYWKPVRPVMEALSLTVAKHVWVG